MFCLLTFNQDKWLRNITPIDFGYTYIKSKGVLSSYQWINILVKFVESQRDIMEACLFLLVGSHWSCVYNLGTGCHVRWIDLCLKLEQTAGRAAALWRQRPGLDPDLRCCLSGVCSFSLRPCGFRLGAPVFPHISKMCGFVD